jgi:tRNA C32,U32 (ribose-2'-O)-methylase TrmJ
MVVRSIFARTELEDRDVRVLRGMVGKIDCYAKWIERGKGKRKGNRDDDDSELG